MKEDNFHCYPYNSEKNLDNMIKNKRIGRGLEGYLLEGGVLISELIGKKVLDIGSGSAKFANEAKEKGVDIVALDPMYSFEKGRYILRNEAGDWKNRENSLKAVAGIAEALPFANETFDVIINMYSAFLYCRTPEDLEKLFWEEMRALKKGGEIIIICFDEICNPSEEIKKRAFEISPNPCEKEQKKTEEVYITLAVDRSVEDADAIKKKFKDLVEKAKDFLKYSVEYKENNSGHSLIIKK